MKIAFLRHGPTEWNRQGRIQGHTDIGLSPDGAAKMAALRLPPAVSTARVFVSPLSRARQTAALLGLSGEVADARLMEQHWGEWEGLTRDEIKAKHGKDCFERAGLAESFRPLGGESTGELHARVAHFLRDVAAGPLYGNGGDAVAVAHLGVLRAAYTLATGWDMATAMPGDLDVSCILLLSLDEDGTPSVAALNVEFAPAQPADALMIGIGDSNSRTA
jgi:probable phosphoglycerate mutase